jgi:hypothetical protein
MFRAVGLGDFGEEQMIIPGPLDPAEDSEDEGLTHTQAVERAGGRR